MYAEVIVDITHEDLDRTFTYRIPPVYEHEIRPGSVVSIPFGRANTPRRGYVLEIKETCGYDPSKVKDLLGIDAKSIPVESRLIELAAFLKETYGSTMYRALKTVMPVKASVKSVSKTTVFANADREALAEYRQLCERRKYRARIRLLDCLLRQREWDLADLIKQAAVGKDTIRTMELAGMLTIEDERMYRLPSMEKNTRYERKQLNTRQQAAVDQIMADRDKGLYKTYLLHGITGSGKTEVYLELMEQVLAEGQQVIVLIPEISLTYQTLTRFYTRFGDRVAVVNSKMSDGERYDQFERAKSKDADIMIGPRSALFTPFDNIGLIIIDEEHEGSYKSENMPRYHAVEVASFRALSSNATLVLGSATPSVASAYRAQTGEYELISIKERAGEGTVPAVTVVDMREETKAGNTGIFSNYLLDRIQDRLEKKQQTMLFLNRRGYAGYVSCRSCGIVLKCPHCDVSLTLHKKIDGTRLVCHYCGFERTMVKECPICKSSYISEWKVGTQQVEEQLKELYPGARVLRMDMDTTREKDGHEKILREFADGNADILVGTQMIVKGHDFPGVTLVGALSADQSLNTGDYRSAEKTFQLLVQAAGRAGRGALAGEMVIQSFQPEHYAIEMAAKQDYEGFYQQEMLFRKMLHYPPQDDMLAIQMSCSDEEYLKIAADFLLKMARRIVGEKVQIIGPADAAIAKLKDRYRKTIYIKHSSPVFLRALRGRLEQYIEANEGFKTVGIFFDHNPQNML